MELSQFTDFSLRALIYAGSKPRGLCTVPEVAGSFGISRNHLVKVVNNLAKLGFVSTKRGRNGGFQLAMAPEDINVGKLVRVTENLHLVECFDEIGNSCPIHNSCVLKRALHQAQNAFLEVLDSYTIADFISSEPLMAQLGISL
jgi:Rrf2 family nitric oxide-sensitive transcriptional repressor